MSREIAAAVAVSATLLAGAAAGTTLLGPVSAIAETASTDSGPARPNWFADALEELVDDGTINQSQADAVGAALREARPSRGGHPRHRSGPHPALATAAGAIGIDESELARALRGGRSLADVARERDVDLAKVVDALVEEATERVDQA